MNGILNDSDIKTISNQNYYNAPNAYMIGYIQHNTENRYIFTSDNNNSGNKISAISGRVKKRSLEMDR